MIHAKRMLYLAMFAFCFLLLFAAPAAAESGDWRPVYDVIMLWVNFVILVAVLFKLLRRPLRDFFQDKKEAVAAEIERIEAEKDRALRRVEDAKAEMEDSQARRKRVRKRIVAEGERIRDQIIEDARDHSRVMITQAKRRVDNQIFSARRQLQSELIDMAVDISLKRLPEEVTEADNQRYIDLYLKTAV
jgi:F-type H+-transporting ATPase subunit b